MSVNVGTSVAGRVGGSVALRIITVAAKLGTTMVRAIVALGRTGAAATNPIGIGVNVGGGVGVMKAARVAGGVGLADPGKPGETVAVISAVFSTTVVAVGTAGIGVSVAASAVFSTAAVAVGSAGTGVSVAVSGACNAVAVQVGGRTAPSGEDWLVSRSAVVGVAPPAGSAVNGTAVVRNAPDRLDRAAGAGRSATYQTVSRIATLTPNIRI